MSLDLSRWLAEFPVREHCLYLDHAAVCPLPRSVAAAMRQRVQEQEDEGHLKYHEWKHHILTCRHLGAQLIGCKPDDISIINSTSQGLSMIAEGIDWQEKDRVLLGEEEFAANAAPWLHLESRGVVVDRFRQPDGQISPDDLADELTPNTRVLAVSWVAFHTGWIAPLAQLSRACKDNGTLLIVDAIQGLGILPMSMKTLGVDAVIADGHKWLLGPEGAGIMATSPELRKQLRPILSGWQNVQLEPGDFFLQHAEHHSDGRRFEPGAANGVGIAGLAAALDLLNAVGPVEVHSRVETMSRLLTRILLAHGWDVYSPGSGHPVAGIVAARHPGIAPKEARRRLSERKIVCSVRQGYVRFSPHFYITKGELEAFDRILEKVGL
ncbi:MAG: aminotransferase class V-fold PLP-dependent enzyme [bacterium]|nr:aminotransferase class V-fold PLP-dependent enzyme [bacterium]